MKGIRVFLLGISGLALVIALIPFFIVWLVACHPICCWLESELEGY